MLVTSDRRLVKWRSRNRIASWPHSHLLFFPRHLKRSRIPRYDHSMSKIPPAPRGSGPAGRRLWTAVQRTYELESHEDALLVAMCRTADRLDALEKIAAEQGLTTTGHGTQKISPAVVEYRQQAITYARLATALRLPAGEDNGEERRPQRRGAPRGVYQLHGGAA